MMNPAIDVLWCDCVVNPMIRNSTASAAQRQNLEKEGRYFRIWLNELRRLILLMDVFDASPPVSFDFLKTEVIDHVSKPPGRNHEWFWVTEQPEQMVEFCKWLKGNGHDWPSNLRAGTAISTQAATSRIKALLEVGNPNTRRFLLIEPQWEPINLDEWLPHLNWVIQSGESRGQGEHPFDLSWALDLKKSCQKHRVAYFLNQLGTVACYNGERLNLKDPYGRDWSEWPQIIRRRQVDVGCCACSPSVSEERQEEMSWEQDIRDDERFYEKGARDGRTWVTGLSDYKDLEAMADYRDSCASDWRDHLEAHLSLNCLDHAKEPHLSFEFPGGPDLCALANWVAFTVRPAIMGNFEKSAAFWAELVFPEARKESIDGCEDLDTIQDETWRLQEDEEGRLWQPGYVRGFCDGALTCWDEMLNKTTQNDPAEGTLDNEDERDQSDIEDEENEKTTDIEDDDKGEESLDNEDATTTKTKRRPSTRKVGRGKSLAKKASRRNTSKKSSPRKG